jgi:hypothetical protein
LKAYGTRPKAKPSAGSAKSSSKSRRRSRQDAIKAAGTDRGYALLTDAGKPGFIEALLTHSQFHLIVLADDAALKTRLAQSRTSMVNEWLFCRSKFRAAPLLRERHFIRRR